MGYLITETTESGQLIKDYIRQEGLHPVAQIDNNGGTESINYLYTDHLMTSRLATGQNQSIVWRWEGEAFGNTPAQELAGVEINLRFPGQYFDEESGLHYNHHRYYSPETGRYITSDPIGLDGGINTYGYALQNPVKYIDPDGLNVATGVGVVVVVGICVRYPRACGAVAEAIIGGVTGGIICTITGKCDAANDDDFEDCPDPDECELRRNFLIIQEIKIKEDGRGAPSGANEIQHAAMIRARKVAWNKAVDKYNRECPRKIGRRFKI